MSSSESEIKAKMEELNKQIMTLEWDKKRNQLFSGKIALLEKLKAEYSALEAQLSAINNE